MRIVVGWDVGGAHLKAARAENGRIVDAVQVASPLRLGLEQLARSFVEAKARIGTADLHAVTMTGELADTFASRVDGVEKLSALAVSELAPARVSLYAGRAASSRRKPPVSMPTISHRPTGLPALHLLLALQARPYSSTWARRRPIWCRWWTARSPLADTPMPSG